MVENFFTCAKETSAADGDVHQDEMGSHLVALVVSSGLVYAGSDVAGSAHSVSSTFTTIFSFNGGTSILETLRCAGTLASSFMRRISTVLTRLHSVSQCKIGTSASL